MTKARRKEGPRAPLFFSEAAVMLLCAAPADAQSVDVSALEICAALETPELQLNCFNAIIADNKTQETREPETVAPPVAEEHVAEIATVPETQPPAEAMAKEAPAVDAATDRTPATVAASSVPVVVATEPPVEVMSQDAPAVDAAPDSTPAVVATSTAAVAATPEPSASGQPGEEHLDRPETKEKANEDEVFYATVTEVTKDHNKTLYFHFDNGQVWRQIEARHLEYPRSGEFDINITRGMMGDYRMRIGDNGRMVRIRRVQ
jgi:hypothetical protein